MGKKERGTGEKVVVSDQLQQDAKLKRKQYEAKLNELHMELVNMRIGSRRPCPEFERMLVCSGLILLKYWFSVSDEEQERRFHDQAGNPARRWKLSEMDLQARDKWLEFDYHF
jgi:polyphosphate kinase 2 (PPK2 family)